MLVVLLNTITRQTITNHNGEFNRDNGLKNEHKFNKDKDEVTNEINLVRLLSPSPLFWKLKVESKSFILKRQNRKY